MSEPGTSEASSEFPELPGADDLARLFPQYDVLELLGRGGMGAVYKARQKSLDRFVALKVLPRHLADLDPTFASRFQQEARTLARMSHPGIVPVHDFGDAAGEQLYFVMELIDGTDVERRIAAEGRLPVAEAVRITEAVCDALAYAHERGVIHRDIKPANVLIRGDGRVLVADFGLAKAGGALEAKLTRTDVTMGTQAFAAPELLTPGAKVDQRADLYSLGVMLYEMLTGEIPRVMFKLPSRIRPELGSRFDAIICKALETDPEERFQDAAEFRRALTAAMSSPDQQLPARRKRRWAALAAAALIAAALIFGVVHFHGPGRAPEVSPARAEEPGAIKLWDAPEKLPKGARWEDSAMRLDNVMTVSKPPYARDVVIRATIKTNPDALSPSISVRGFEANGVEGRYSAVLSAQEGKITLQVFGTNHVTLREWPLPRAYGPAEWARLELRAIGDELTVSIDEQVLGSIHDSSIDKAGMAQVYAKKAGFFRDVVVVPMDHGIAASPPNVSEPISIKLWDTAAKVPKETAVRWENGAVVLGDAQNKGLLNWAQPRSRDAIFRAEIRANPDAEYPQLRLRYNWTEGLGDFYRLQLNDGIISLSASVLGKGRELQAWPLPRAYRADEWVPLELRAVGDELTVSLEGRTLGTIRDSSLAGPGSVMLVASRNGYFRNVEYVPLDPPSEMRPGGRVVDLLPLVDVKRDAINSVWTVSSEGELQSARGRTAARIEFPYHPPAEYDFEVEFTVEDGNSGYVVQVLSVPGHWFDWRLLPPPAIGPALDGVEVGHGPRTEAIGKLNRLKPGERHRSVVEVRTHSVRAVVDGTEIVRFTGDLQRLSDPAGIFRLRDTTHLGVGVLDVGIRVHKAIVREMKSAEIGAQPSIRPPEIDLLPLADLQRDAVVGDWSRGAEGLSVAHPNGASVLELPYSPPEEYDFETEFTPADTGGNVNLYLSAGGHSFAWKLNAHGRTPPLYGFEMLDGKFCKDFDEAATRLPTSIEPGHRYRTTVEVRRTGLRALLDGKELVKWSGDFRRFSMEDITRLRDAHHLGLGSWKRAVTFHTAVVRDIASTADHAPTRSTAPAARPLPTNEWIPLLHTPEALARSGVKGLTFDGLWLTLSTEPLYLVRLADGKEKRRDMAFRMTVHPPTNEWPVIAVLHAGADPQYNLDIHHDRLVLTRVAEVTSPEPIYTKLKEVPLRLAPAGTAKMEVSISGDRITVLADGNRCIEIRDPGIDRAGDILLSAAQGAGSTGKLQDLAFKASDPSTPAGTAWTPFDLRTHGWVRDGDGITTRRPMQGFGILPAGTTDGAARVTYFLRDSHGVQISARDMGDGETRQLYVADDTGSELIISRVGPKGQSTRLAAQPYPPGLTRDSEHTLEFRIVGDRLSASVNGLVNLTAADQTLASGPWSLVLRDGALANKLEVQIAPISH